MTTFFDLLVAKGLKPTVALNPALDNLGTESAFSFSAQVQKAEQSGKFPQVFKFHIGDTGPKTPEPIIEVAIQALRDKQTKYAPFLGYPQVRANIARHIRETRGVAVEADNIMLEPGGKPAIELSIQALVGPEDYIIGQNPAFPIYESLASFYAPGRYIPWLAKESAGGLEFDVDDLAEILAKNKNVKLLIINTPHNPIGTILTRDKIAKIAALSQKYNFMVLFDDIYDQVIFSGHEHFSLLSVPGMLGRVINLSGYSKNFSMTGWRLGYVVAPKWVIEIFGKLAVNKWSCVNRVNQIVAGAIFGDVEVDGFKYSSVADKIKPIIAADTFEYERKGKFLVEALSMLKPLVIPNQVQGAFYDFPSVVGLLNLSYVKNNLKITSDKDLSQWLLSDRGIATLPGSDFGVGGNGHLRFSYAEDRQKHIIPGIKRFIEVVIELAKKSDVSLPMPEETVYKNLEKITQDTFS